MNVVVENYYGISLSGVCLCSFLCELGFSFSLICYCLYLLFRYDQPKLFFGIDLVNFGEGMTTFLKFVFVVAFIEYIGMCAMEINAGLVGARKNKNEMAGFLILQNILYIISMVGLGLAFAVRTYLNKAIGESSFIKVKLCISNSYILCVICSFVEIAFLV